MVHLHRLKCTLFFYRSGILFTIESLDATALNFPYISERTTVNCMYRGAEDWWVEPPDDEPLLLATIAQFCHGGRDGGQGSSF